MQATFMVEAWLMLYCICLSNRLGYAALNRHRFLGTERFVVVFVDYRFSLIVISVAWYDRHFANVGTELACVLLFHFCETAGRRIKSLFNFMPAAACLGSL